MTAEQERKKAAGEAEAAANAKAVAEAKAADASKMDFLDFTLGLGEPEAEAEEIATPEAGAAVSAPGGFLDEVASEGHFVAANGPRMFGDIISDPADRERFKRIAGIMAAQRGPAAESGRQKTAQAEAEHTR